MQIAPRAGAGAALVAVASTVYYTDGDCSRSSDREEEEGSSPLLFRPQRGATVLERVGVFSQDQRESVRT